MPRNILLQGSLSKPEDRKKHFHASTWHEGDHFRVPALIRCFQDLAPSWRMAPQSCPVSRTEYLLWRILLSLKTVALLTSRSGSPETWSLSMQFKRVGKSKGASSLLRTWNIAEKPGTWRIVCHAAGLNPRWKPRRACEILFLRRNSVPLRCIYLSHQVFYVSPCFRFRWSRVRTRMS